MGAWKNPLKSFKDFNLQNTTQQFFFYLTPFKTPYTHFERRHFEYWRLTPSGVVTAYVQALIISAVERGISRMVRLLFVL